jgi:hypothetical protein
MAIAVETIPAAPRQGEGIKKMSTPERKCISGPE